MKTLVAAIVALNLLGISFQTGVSSDRVGDSPVAPDAGLISFSRLAAGHTLQVTYVVGGCFRSGPSSTEMTFHGGDPVTVTAVDIYEDWDPATRKYLPPEQEQIGSLALSDDDVADLDSLLRFYRVHGDESRCTSTESLDIRHLINNRVAAAEKFRDATCDTHRMKGITTFGHLLFRLRNSMVGSRFFRPRR